MTTEQNSGLIDLDALMREAAAAERASKALGEPPLVAAWQRPAQPRAGGGVATRTVVALALTLAAATTLTAWRGTFASREAAAEISPAPPPKEVCPEPSRAAPAPAVTVEARAALVTGTTKPDVAPVRARGRAAPRKKATHEPSPVPVAAVEVEREEPPRADGPPPADAPATSSPAPREAPEPPAPAEPSEPRAPANLHDAIVDAVGRARSDPATDSAAARPGAEQPIP